MRLLLVSDSYPPLIGGATRFIRQMAEGLQERGHDVAVATAEQEGYREDGVENGIQVFRVGDFTTRLSALSSDDTRHTPPPWTDPSATLQLNRVIATARPDLVFSYGWISYAASVAAARHDVPFILSTQDYCQICPKRTLLYRDDTICSGPGLSKCARCAGAFYGRPKGTLATFGVQSGARVLAPRISGVTFASHYMQDLFADTVPKLIGGRRHPKQAVIPAFAEPSPDEEGPDEAVLAALPERYIMYVGALRKVKGVELLADAYRGLADAPPLVFFGTRAPDTPTLDGPGIHIVQGAQNATVMAAWRNAAFGVFPSLWAEPLGIVVHEAMSQGKPVIGTRPGGHGEMITDGRTGYLTPIGDREALRDAMQRLVSDDALREGMGRAAAEAALRFRREPLLDRFETFFQDVVGGRAD